MDKLLKEDGFRLEANQEGFVLLEGPDAVIEIFSTDVANLRMKISIQDDRLWQTEKSRN